MPDLAAISTALTSIKTATDIARMIRAGDVSMQEAELKLRLADLLTSLADARTQLAEVQDVIAGKNRRIAELEEAFAAKDTVRRRDDAYYRLNDNREPEGEAHCVRCWEVDHHLHQLVQSSLDHLLRRCPACNQTFAASRTNPI